MKRFLFLMTMLMASITTVFAEKMCGSCVNNVNFTLSDDNGEDVTSYLFNPNFTKDLSGWNVVGATLGYSKNYGQGENANADLCQEAPLEDDGLAECYHALFDMSQTIKNLPAGLYTLSVQGFDRHDDGYKESAQLYATFSDGSEQTQDFASLDDYKTEDRLYLKLNADGNAEWMSDAGRDGGSYWVPNGMTGAAWHFVNKKDGVNYDYTNKLQFLMKEAGDLTVGVRVKNTHQWIIWDNFTLVYEGKDETGYEDETQNIENTDIASLSDAVYVAPMEGKVGSQVVLPIQMKSSIAATGFQADLVLPEGITVAEDSDGFPMVELSTQRTTPAKTNIFDCDYQSDGSLRILCNSTKGIAFTGNDGEVALVTLNISEDLDEGDYPIVLENIVITEAQGTNKKKVDLVKSTLTLFAYTLGDANGDDEVDVADISSIASHVLGREVPGFVEKAADVNVDNEIDVADISALAYLILHPETAQKAKARKVAEKKELTENAYNTLYAEMLQAEAGTDVVLPIMMRNSIEATGFQLDLVLPEGVTLKDAALSNARTSSKRTSLFDYAHQADGTHRILCNSTKGLSFNGHDGEVMTLTLHIDKDAELGAQIIALKDMVLTDATGMLREESSLSESTLWVGNATDIHEIASEKDAPAYDLQGRQVSKKQKGIHIQSGKKTVVK